MRVQRIFFISFLFAVCVSVAACFTDKATLDLSGYVNQDILRIAELETKSLERYAAVTGANYTSDKKVVEALRDFVIPNYRRFFDLLEDIQPPNDELKGLHGIYLRGAELLYRGFKAKLAGIEGGDENAVRSANVQIEKGWSEGQRWRRELMILYKKHGLEEKK